MSATECASLRTRSMVEMHGTDAPVGFEGVFDSVAHEVRRALDDATARGASIAELGVLLRRDKTNRLVVSCTDRHEILRALARDRSVTWEAQRAMARKIGGAGLDELPVVLVSNGELSLGMVTRLDDAVLVRPS